MPSIITLLSDFGLQDGYAASMKGIILTLCPEAQLVDITHMIPPQDIRAGAFVLGTVYRDFPRGSIHLAVVDPGVGTDRRGLAFQAGGYSFVGPDNGLFSAILDVEDNARAHSLEDSTWWLPSVSSTFHGRDIFAPVAAHLARRVPLENLGPPCRPFMARWASPTRQDDALLGEVIYVDRFGNGITNIKRQNLEAFTPRKQRQWIVTITRRTGLMELKVSNTYGEANPGSPLALIGSSGHLEIAVNQDSAARLLGVCPGTPVTVSRRPNLR